MNPGTIFTTKIKYNKREDINKRNDSIIDFFNNCGLSVRLVGNAINPAVILESNNSIRPNLSLSISFKENTMILKKDAIKGSDEFDTIDLTDNTNDTKDRVVDFVTNGMHKTVFKIYMECNAVPTNKLYLGYYKHNDNEISPTFTAEPYKSAIFFSKESRDFIYDKLISNHYNCLTE